MASLEQIEEFLATESLALAGVSRNPAKFGAVAFRELRTKGMNLVPVNPYAEKIMGIDVYHDVKSLPEHIRGLIIMTRKDQTAGIVREAREKGIKQIWIQQMAASREALDELEGSGINCITGECILMHYKPSGIHKFHLKLRKFFGLFPK
ncbi:MAG TPA: CoA-binding protein [Bacteroidales bacterium]|jgi:hypothetical protein|nr:hypothetical protein [Bacteroidales bacterium]HNR41313.1 CoA-binding protein [Bacteroidales bacterium]HPM18354.1 CoA-binding protein [Bacteroidales bacterium]HQG75992.1 CoA-binding protein [Bacteroidales bacterium]